MKKLVIYATHVFNFNTNEFSIGGVQTYIRDLSLLGIECGADSLVYDSYDFDGEPRTSDYKGVKVIEYNKCGSFQKSFEKIYSKENGEDVVFVIATDQYLIKSSQKNVIQVQHGIAFDIPGYYLGGIWRVKYLWKINKLIRCMRNVNRLYQTPNTVCVDYNYFNWFRTIGTEIDGQHMHIIPNYSSGFISIDELRKKLSIQKPVKRIVFARRFEDYRGAILFSKVASKLLKERDDVEITFAGGGSCIDKMKNILNGCSNYYFTSYSSSNSIAFHKDFDIAIVPTIFSEGTSLSLIEAMAAGCLPIASHVGGMTNIILDKFNGFLVYPSEEKLYEVIINVLDLEKDSFNSIVENSYKSAFYSFSIDKWKESWKELLLNL